MSSSPFASMSWTIGVSIVPGQTALMRMPRDAYSRAALLVRPSPPCFEASYVELDRKLRQQSEEFARLTEEVRGYLADVMPSLLAQVSTSV